MKNFSSATDRLRRLAAVVGACWAPALLAQPLPFDGRWLLDAHPDAQAAYTRLTIKDATLSWAGPTRSAPKCVQQFVPVKEARGTVYTNGHGTQFVTGVPGSLPTYLLKLTASTCGNVDELVRISFPLVYDTNHIELIEYISGKPVSARWFRIGK